MILALFSFTYFSKILNCFFDIFSSPILILSTLIKKNSLNFKVFVIVFLTGQWTLRIARGEYGKIPPRQQPIRLRHSPKQMLAMQCFFILHKAKCYRMEMSLLSCLSKGMQGLVKWRSWLIVLTLQSSVLFMQGISEDATWLCRMLDYVFIILVIQS